MHVDFIGANKMLLKSDMFVSGKATKVAVAAFLLISNRLLLHKYKIIIARK